MKRSLILSSLIAAVLALGSGVAASADKPQSGMQERIYGSNLMTTKERNDYRARMRAAKTQEERERIRAEHHEKMQIRAKEKGFTLPDEPPMTKGRMGPGSGMGPGAGMGPGSGMGPGGGMGPGSGMGSGKP